MLKAKFRFRPGHRDSYHRGSPWKLRSLFLNLTERCNLNCGYCHAVPGKEPDALPLSLVTGVLDQAAAMGGTAVFLTGGEPFCYPHFENVLKLCAERGLACKIATNGTFLDEARVDMLLRHAVRSLQVSLDTLDPSVYAALKGTRPDAFRDVVDGIRRCLRTGRLHVAVSSVAQRTALAGLADVLRFCHDEGVNTFTVYRVIPFGRAAMCDASGVPGEEEFIGLLDSLFTRFVGLPEHWAVDLGFPWASDCPLSRKWGSRVSVQAVGCVGGKSNMTILANGDAVPCVCLEDRSFSCGNVARTPLAELWQAPVMRCFRGEERIEGCDGCPQFGFCLGGCRTLAYLATGSRGARDPVCRHWQSGSCRVGADTV